jgi:hypothetical protein
VPRPEPHFRGTWANIATNGVFNRQGYFAWFLALLASCGGSFALHPCAPGSFVAYAAVCSYVGFSSILIRDIHGDTAL